MGALQQQQQQQGSLPQTEAIPAPQVQLPPPGAGGPPQGAGAPPGAGGPPQGTGAPPGAGGPPQGAGAPPGAGGPPQGAGGPPQGAGAPDGISAMKKPGPAGFSDGVSPKEEQATAAEQKEYERAMKALMKILYESEEASNAIMQQVSPDDKITTAVKASVLLVNQLDEKIDMDDSIVSEITGEVTSRIMELAESRYGIPFEENEQQAVLGATWEGILLSFGVDEKQVSGFMDQYSEEELGKIHKSQEDFING